MKKWNNYPVFQCVCGFETLDEDEFEKHIRRNNHQPILFREKTKPAAIVVPIVEPVPQEPAAEKPIAASEPVKRRKRQEEADHSVIEYGNTPAEGTGYEEINNEHSHE